MQNIRNLFRRGVPAGGVWEILGHSYEVEWTDFMEGEAWIGDPTITESKH